MPEPGKTARGKAAVREVLRALRACHPDARCTLRHRNALELLVATILSAQCTDERVNQLTPKLFAKYRTASDYVTADPHIFENEIRPSGFFRMKAHAILGAMKAIAEGHGGAVPRSMEELTALPGVGRKTANVILGNVFGVPGIVVDTHVGRVARRLGLTRHEDPVKVERDLMEIVPRDRWTRFSHEMILHGRRICVARTPRCGDCPLEPFCEKKGVPPRKASR